MEQIVDRLVKSSLLARECREEMNNMVKMLDRMRSSCRITCYLFPQTFMDLDMTSIYSNICGGKITKPTGSSVAFPTKLDFHVMKSKQDCKNSDWGRT